MMKRAKREYSAVAYMHNLARLDPTVVRLRAGASPRKGGLLRMTRVDVLLPRLGHDGSGSLAFSPISG